ncbi:MAG: DEAD/DEAH box helicase [Pedosphaera sp.]|nr:DEAD/DEAH box helicase [Pedosphaera sp.]
MLDRVHVPDLWQQEAVAAIIDGKDVVVHAPTGAGKTFIFELWFQQNRGRGQSVYTVPTRALANDKLAEWRAKGWDVGIATGDLAENLDAPLIVATLETQKGRLIRGDGPVLLVVDEYQMIGDADRGLNYELALALAPSRTRLLLLSGSVANPQQVVRWLCRIGRSAILVRYDERPVPLEEVNAGMLNFKVPAEVKGYWPRFVAKSLAEDLGPILIFAPRRAETEQLAGELARFLPNPNPLTLSPEQRQLAGDRLARMLQSRIAFHHSGLSYAARAGVVEPLAKAGQLRAVVATMGLAAGINFSLRSVALAADSYKRRGVEVPLRCDEILQMFGRAGRRGLDEAGYVLVSANDLRLRDANPAQLTRNGLVDWGVLLGIMSMAVERGLDPFGEAVRVQRRLFSSQPILIGVESCLDHPDAPCGIQTDAGRARHVESKVKEMLNSRGEWQRCPASSEVLLGDVRVVVPPATGKNGVVESVPVLSVSDALGGIGTGTLAVVKQVDGMDIWGRASTVAEVLPDGNLMLARWVARSIQWRNRLVNPSVWEAKIVPLLKSKMETTNTPLIGFDRQRQRIVAHLSLAKLKAHVPVDAHGIGIWEPTVREDSPADCANCVLTSTCRSLSKSAGVVLLWQRLSLIDSSGVPTQRGRVVSFFSQGSGLALAAALEDRRYRIEELVFDLANLDGGFRFCSDGDRWDGRLAFVCRATYGLMNIQGYLENGVPPGYGSGAEKVVASVSKNPSSKREWETEFTGVGDIDRIIIEWRSMLRQIVHAPALDWDRWVAFQKVAQELLKETQSPTLTKLPPLEFQQTKRIEHRLQLRRH